MKKLSLSFLLFAVASFTAVSSQGLCDAIKGIAGSSSSGFESLKGKYSSSDYEGQWIATTKVPGASSCIIDENSGMYVATMGTNLSEKAASDLVKKLSGQLDCLAGWNNWRYDNEGERVYQIVYSERSENLNADGGNYGGWGQGYTPKWNGNAREYSSYDKVPKGQTVQIDLRKSNGKYEVRILIFDGK